MNEPADKHYPVAEMSSSSKLSCLSWNKSMQNQIGCSDYEGTITLWDVSTCQVMIYHISLSFLIKDSFEVCLFTVLFFFQIVKEFSEHENRIWSIDFSITEPSLLASGGDGCKVISSS